MWETGVPWLCSSAVDEERKGRHNDNEANQLLYFTQALLHFA